METNPMNETELKVEGMTCSSCVRHVREALQGVDGVLGADVELDGGRARVRHTAKATRAALVAAIEDAGYLALNEA